MKIINYKHELLCMNYAEPSCVINERIFFSWRRKKKAGMYINDLKNKGVPALQS